MRPCAGAVYDVDQRGVRIGVIEVDDGRPLRGGGDGLRSRGRIDHEQEEVGSDWAGTELACLVEPRGDDIRRITGHRHHPQPSGRSYGRGQPGVRTTADRRLLDRDRTTDELRERVVSMDCLLWRHPSVVCRSAPGYVAARSQARQ